MIWCDQRIFVFHCVTDASSSAHSSGAMYGGLATIRSHFNTGGSAAKRSDLMSVNSAYDYVEYFLAHTQGHDQHYQQHR